MKGSFFGLIGFSVLSKVLIYCIYILALAGKVHDQLSWRLLSCVVGLLLSCLRRSYALTAPFWLSPFRSKNDDSRPRWLLQI